MFANSSERTVVGLKTIVLVWVEIISYKTIDRVLLLLWNFWVIFVLAVKFWKTRRKKEILLKLKQYPVQPLDEPLFFDGIRFWVEYEPSSVLLGIKYG